MTGTGRSALREQGILKPLAAGLSLSAVFVAVVAIPLEAAAQLGLTDARTSAWITAVWGIPSVLTLIVARRYNQPLVLTGNVFILIFVLLLGGDLSWPELVGSTMAAGVIVLILGLTGLTHRLASVLPAPIVYGLLSGAVLGLAADSFTQLGTETLVVGSTFLAYFLSRAYVGERIPALLSALTVGVVVAVLSSQIGPVPESTWPMITITLPTFTWTAILTATPVLIVFIALQANAPSVVYLRDQGYEPPERLLSVISGAATTVGSIFGPMGVSLSLPATALVGGPDAGRYDKRVWGVYLAATVGIIVALASGFATDLLEFIPASLLGAIVGLAALGILAQSLKEITRGPLLLGPLVAFVVSVSDIELIGMGRFFWAIVFGLAVSLLLERAEWSGIHKTGQPTG